MKILTYNVHSCVGRDGQISVARIAQVIARAQPDVVCLQEVDVGRRRTRCAHQAREIAAALGMYFEFHPAMRVAAEEYGEAILSPHPLRRVRAWTLPTVRSPLAIEPRGALHAVVQSPGGPWHIVNTHFGLSRMERRAQARALVAEESLATLPAGAPLVVCGDFNSRAGSQTVAILNERWREAQRALGRAPAATFPTRFPLLSLDYFFTNEAVQVRAVTVLDSPLIRQASDHFPVLAELDASEHGGEGA